MEATFTHVHVVVDKLSCLQVMLAVCRLDLRIYESETRYTLNFSIDECTDVELVGLRSRPGHLKAYSETGSFMLSNHQSVGRPEPRVISSGQSKCLVDPGVAPHAWSFGQSNPLSGPPSSCRSGGEHKPALTATKVQVRLGLLRCQLVSCPCLHVPACACPVLHMPACVCPFLSSLMWFDMCISGCTTPGQSTACSIANTFQMMLCLAVHLASRDPRADTLPFRPQLRIPSATGSLSTSKTHIIRYATTKKSLRSSSSAWTSRPHSQSCRGLSKPAARRRMISSAPELASVLCASRTCCHRRFSPH